MIVYQVEWNNCISDLHLESLIHTLDEKEIKYIERKKKYDDRIRSLLGRLLLRWIFVNVYKQPGLPTLYVDHNNRPYQELIRNLDFNISHSGKRIVCGVSQNGKVGVDIQEIVEIDFDNIMSHFFSKDEVYAINEAAEKKRKLLFYILWTLKEASFKANGSNLYISMPVLSQIAYHKPQLVFRSETDRTFLNSILLNEKYYCATSSVDSEVVFKEVNINELFGFLASMCH